MRRFIWLAVFLAGCGDYSGAPKNADPEQKVTGLYMFEMREGSGTWHLTADSADIFDGETKASLVNPVLDYQGLTGAASKTKAKHGLMNFTGRLIELSGEVRSESPAEETSLATELLYYSIPEQKIWTEEKVALTRQGTVSKGRGFSAKPDLSEITIAHQETEFPGKK